MSVSISKIFDIQGRVIAPTSTALSLDICALSKNELLPSTCTTVFTSYQQVLDYFGNATSPDVIYAGIYFKGYDGSTKKPAKLLMARYIDAPTAGFLISMPLPALSVLQAVEDSECTFTVSDKDGKEKVINVEKFNLKTSATSYSNLATALETAINGTVADEAVVSVTYNPGNNTLIIRSLFTGSSSKVLPTTFPNGGAGQDLGLLIGTSVPMVDSIGCDLLTVDQNIAKIIDTVSNFVGFVSFFDMDDKTSVAIASYLNNLEEDYCYFAQTLEASALTPGDITTLAYQMKSLKNVFVMYGSIENVVFASSIGACVDYTNGSTINWSFKKQTGLVADVITDKQFDALLGNSYNFYAQFGLKAMSDDFLTNGNVTGIYNYVDNLYNAIWLKDSLQRDLLTLFTSVGKVSYTPQGYAIIKGALQQSINSGLANNVISTGVILSASQIQLLQLELGIDVSSTLNANGYLLIVDDPGADARINRLSPLCKLIYTYGGGINKIVLETIQVQ